MNRRSLFLAPLVVLFTGLLACAEDFRGVIREVDPDHQEIVVEGRGRRARGQSLRLEVTRDSQIRLGIGRGAGAFADLQPGEHVRVSFEVRDGRRVCLSMTVRGLRTPAAPPAAPPNGSDRPAPAGDANTVAGSLIRVAVTEREIIVVSPGAGGVETETTLTVPEKVQITKDGKPVKLEDLKEGEQVTVKAEKQKGKMAAVSIQVGRAAPAAAAAAPQRVDRIERLRMLLKVADWLLQQAQEYRQNR
jgi:hypothetical protein